MSSVPIFTHGRRPTGRDHLNEHLEVVDALDGQLQVLAQPLRVADPLAVLLSVGTKQHGQPIELRRITWHRTTLFHNLDLYFKLVYALWHHLSGQASKGLV